MGAWRRQGPGVSPPTMGSVCPVERKGRHRDAYGWGGGKEWGDQFHLGQKLCPLGEQESPPGAPRAGSKGR